MVYRLRIAAGLERCRRCSTPDQLTFAHLVPNIDGGRLSFGNVTIMCRSCNWSDGPRLVTDAVSLQAEERAAPRERQWTRIARRRARQLGLLGRFGKLRATDIPLREVLGIDEQPADEPELHWTPQQQERVAVVRADHEARRADWSAAASERAAERQLNEQGAALHGVTCGGPLAPQRAVLVEPVLSVLRARHPGSIHWTELATAVGIDPDTLEGSHVRAVLRVLNRRGLAEPIEQEWRCVS